MEFERREFLAAAGSLAAAGFAGCVGQAALGGRLDAGTVDRTVGDTVERDGLRLSVEGFETATRVGRVYDCPCGEPVVKESVAGDDETIVLTRLALENVADGPREFPARATEGTGDVRLYARGAALAVPRLTVETSYTHAPIRFETDGTELVSLQQAATEAGAHPDPAPPGTRIDGWVCNVAPEFDPAETVVEVAVDGEPVRWRLGE
jgi:hypothetical protein